MRTKSNTTNISSSIEFQINEENMNEKTLNNKEIDQNLKKPYERLDYQPDPYLVLSQEDYTEHKFQILQCKFSKDGKFIASLDIQNVIKSK
jgi:hypothetical protein